MIKQYFQDIQDTKYKLAILYKHNRTKMVVWSTMPEFIALATPATRLGYVFRSLGNGGCHWTRKARDEFEP